MEITGRITADAKISTLKDQRQVVNFSIAVNDSFKRKGAEDVTKVTTYFNCSYWLNPAIAAHLVKGQLVECNGRISANAWLNSEGEAKASLNFHVSSIKLHGKAAAAKQHLTDSAEITEPLEDLPF